MMPGKSLAADLAADTPALILENVTAGIGPLTILHDLSMVVPAKKIAVVLGANGAGKTTLLRTIAGLLPPRSGRICLFGEPIHGRPAHLVTRAGVGHVPSGRELFPRLSVADHLELAGKVSSPSRRIEIREWLLEMFPVLAERLRQPVGTMSGGQQQMVAIARALMSRPKLLLLDEPSLGLAPIVVKQIFSTLRELAKTGMTIFLVEQNANHALKLSDRAYVMVNGQIRMSGTGQELLVNEEVRNAYLGGH